MTRDYAKTVASRDLIVSDMLGRGGQEMSRERDGGNYPPDGHRWRVDLLTQHKNKRPGSFVQDTTAAE